MTGCSIGAVDDATKRLLYAEVRDGGESVGAIMTALHAVFTRYGLPMALYTDRAHWAVHTPVAGGAPDRRRLTQVGRALARLGIEHILGYSPAARGRSERVNRTLQDRLVNELRLAGITTVPAANRYLRERFLPAFNDEFGRPPADPAPAFVPLGRVDLEQMLCLEEERVVGRDNVVTADRVALQLAKQPGRRTCAGLRVLIRRHLSGPGRAPPRARTRRRRSACWPARRGRRRRARARGGRRSTGRRWPRRSRSSGRPPGASGRSGSIPSCPSSSTGSRAPVSCGWRPRSTSSSGRSVPPPSAGCPPPRAPPGPDPGPRPPPWAPGSGPR